MSNSHEIPLPMTIGKVHPNYGYLKEDARNGEWTRMEVLALADHRGRISGTDQERVFYWTDAPVFRGQIVRWDGDSWIPQEDFISEEAKIRSQWITHIRAKWQHLDSAPLLDALFLGISHKPIQDLFRDCGLSFLLALSGMHTSLMIFFLSHSILCLLPYKYRTPWLICFLLCFVWITGVRHSLIRAVIMFALGRWLIARGRLESPMKGWLLSLVIHTFLFPKGISFISFQFSYLAMAGLYLFSPIVERILPRFLPNVLKKMLSLSLGAQLALGPLQILYFGEFQPLCIVWVLFMAPIISLFLWVGMVYVLIFPLPFINTYLGNLLDQLYKLIWILGTFFSKIPLLHTGMSLWKSLLWSLTLCMGWILPLIRRNKEKEEYFGKKFRLKLRFSNGNQDLTGNDGFGTQEALGTEFPDQSRSPKKNFGSIADAKGP